MNVQLVAADKLSQCAPVSGMAVLLCSGTKCVCGVVGRGQDG